MTCDKCEDIHAAQLTGFTSEPCKCDCHKKTPDFVIDCTTATSDGLINYCGLGGCETFRL